MHGPVDKAAAAPMSQTHVPTHAWTEVIQSSFQEQHFSIRIKLVGSITNEVCQFNRGLSIIIMEIYSVYHTVS